MAKKLKIMETVVRDGQQSLIATRMPFEDMEPALALMDEVGYEAVECWGGATFDSCIRFLDEDPWERLRKFREAMPNTKLQMLLRGQNLLGYRHYSDDVVDYFVKKSIDNGIDRIRIFDALNDLRNVETAVKSTKAYGAHAQVAMSYTIGEPYTPEYWKDLALRIQDLGADSICIKDMAGLMVPKAAGEMISMLKENVEIPIDLHTHCTSGVAPITYYTAVQAGCDIIDTAISPFSGGTSQPATEVMVETFRGTEYDTGLDINKLSKVAECFQGVRERALESGLLNTKVLATDINTLIYQVPGGMLSNLVSQLKDQNAEDKYMDVLKEIPEVRNDLGMPPLVTPSSQIVGTQAVLNVLMGERYKILTKETKDILRGKYGATPMPMNPDVVAKIDKSEIIDCRPADLLEPELEKLKEEVGEYAEQEEDVLTYALFAQVAIDYFKRRAALRDKVDPDAIDTKNKAYPA
ncbi:MAG: oxaloacetate decarboxylase subunit alpha [Mogibacterium sp.]|nr:oxaloacetate decarboxylase subunit alpha [Mogibacterium sp.]